MNGNDDDDELLDDGDFEFLGRVELDEGGRFQADVYQNTEEEEVELHPDIEGVLALMGLDVHDEDVLIDALTTHSNDITTVGFDFNSPNGRGGYNQDELVRFLRETGWLGVVDIFFDQGVGEYYIMLPESSDVLKTP